MDRVILLVLIIVFTTFALYGQRDKTIRKENNYYDN